MAPYPYNLELKMSEVRPPRLTPALQFLTLLFFRETAQQKAGSQPLPFHHAAGDGFTSRSGWLLSNCKLARSAVPTVAKWAIRSHGESPARVNGERYSDFKA